jgi:tubulin--tyrosine ligase
MIDQSGHPWLIEINNNPCIEESSTLLKQYIPRMMNDAFKLTLDQLFWGSVSNGKFPVPGYKDDENMFLKLDVDFTH